MTDFYQLIQRKLEQLPSVATLLATNSAENIIDELRQDLLEMTLRYETLQSQHQSIESAFAQTPIPTAIFTSDMTYLAVNQQWVTAYNLSVVPEALIGQSHYEIFPTIGDDWKELHQRCLQGEVIEHKRQRFERVDGHVDWLNWRLHPWYTSDDSVGGIIMHTEVVTDLVEAEERENRIFDELQRSEARYRSVVEDQTDLICRYTSDFRLTFVNDAYCRSMGLSRAEALSNNILEKIPQADHERVKNYIQNLSYEHPVGVSEHRTIMPDGTFRWYQWQDRAIFDEQGNVVEYQGVGRDIHKDRLIRDTLYFIVDGNWESDNLSFLDALTRYLAETLQVQQAFVGEYIREDKRTEKVTTKSIYSDNHHGVNIVYALDGTPCKELISQSFCVYPSAVQVYFPEDDILKEMGAESYMGIPLWDANSEPIGVLSIVHHTEISDIETMQAVLKIVAVRAAHELEQQRSLTALNSSHEHYRSVVESMTEGVVVQDKAGQIIEVNEQATTILGYSRDDIIGRYSDDDFWQAVKENGDTFPRGEHPSMVCLQTGYSQHNIIMGLMTPHRGQRWLSINAEPIRYHPETSLPDAVVTTFNDITQRKRGEAIERQAKIMESTLARLQEVNELKTRFVSMVSHEFRTPLAIIMTTVNFLQRINVDDLTTDDLGRRLEKVINQVKRLTNLIDNVTHITRSELSTIEPHFTYIDIRDFCTMLIDEMQLAYPNQETQFALITNGADYLWHTDEVLLTQIMHNLLSNAVKYSDVDATVELKVKTTAHHHEIIVRDTGRGIPEADQKQLFTAFHRATNVENIQGTGLGLLIIKQAVTALKGKITFESYVGEGTTFIVTLPRIANNTSTDVS